MNEAKDGASVGVTGCLPTGGGVAGALPPAAAGETREAARIAHPGLPVHGCRPRLLPPARTADRHRRLPA